MAIHPAPFHPLFCLLVLAQTLRSPRFGSPKISAKSNNLTNVGCLYLEIVLIHSTANSGYNQLVLRVSSYGGGGPKALKHGAGPSSVFGAGRSIPDVGLPAISVSGKKKRGYQLPFRGVYRQSQS